jgi:hypothetical protein
MPTKANKAKLLVELIPTTCHFSNVRTTVKPSEWDKIRFISYAAANDKCEICKKSGKQQGYKHNVECHEIWHYDDENHIQTLIGLISLCPRCHQVKHIGRAMAIGIEKQCYEQLIIVNKWNAEQIKQHIVESFELHKQRSKFEWKLDISILKAEPYNIKLKETENRIFEVKKYKKKKYKKKAKVAGAAKKVHPKAKLAAAIKKTTTPKVGNKKPPKKS